MKHEDLKKFWEEEERLHGPRPPLPDPTPEEMAEFIEIMRRMDGHPGPWLLVPSIEVEQVIAWEESQRAEILGSDVSADTSRS
jgi:hypothetical protein